MGKRIVCLLLLGLLLTGCGARETFETVADLYEQPAAVAQNLHLDLPKEAAAPAVASEDAGNLYICDGYTLTVQTVSGGSLDATLSQVTGFTSDRLTVMHTKQADADRYECVWTCAGETGDQVGRTVVLDDGSYHYAVSVMAPAEKAGDLSQTWRDLLASISISTD